MSTRNVCRKETSYPCFRMEKMYAYGERKEANDRLIDNDMRRNLATMLGCLIRIFNFSYLSRKNMLIILWKQLKKNFRREFFWTELKNSVLIMNFQKMLILSYIFYNL